MYFMLANIPIHLMNFTPNSSRTAHFNVLLTMIIVHAGTVRMGDMIITEFNAENTLPTFHLLAYLTFGRDIAQFDQLIQFLTWLSIALWIFVILTTMLRAGAHVTHVRYRRRNHKNKVQDVPHTPKQSTEKKRHGYS